MKSVGLSLFSLSVLAFSRAAWSGTADVVAVTAR